MFCILNSDIHTKLQKPQQIFDLLELSRRENAARKECINAIRRFRCWKRNVSAQVECSSTMHAQMEGVVFRRHAHDLVVMYKKMRRTRAKLFKNYIAALPDHDIAPMAA